MVAALQHIHSGSWIDRGLHHMEGLLRSTAAAQAQLLVGLPPLAVAVISSAARLAACAALVALAQQALARMEVRVRRGNWWAGAVRGPAHPALSLGELCALLLHHRHPH